MRELLNVAPPLPSPPLLFHLPSFRLLACLPKRNLDGPTMPIPPHVPTALPRADVCPQIVSEDVGSGVSRSGFVNWCTWCQWEAVHTQCHAGVVQWDVGVAPLPGPELPTPCAPTSPG